MSDEPNYQQYPLQVNAGSFPVRSADLLRISTRAGNWAVISHDGELVKFDGAVCRELAEQYNITAQTYPYASIAKLCVLLLDRAAEIVDHIPHEDGTYGDLIRNLHIDIRGDDELYK